MYKEVFYKEVLFYHQEELFFCGCYGKMRLVYIYIIMSIPNEYSN